MFVRKLADFLDPHPLSVRTSYMEAPKATALLVIAFAVEVAVTVVSDFAKRFSADGAIKHTCMHSPAVCVQGK